MSRNRRTINTEELTFDEMRKLRNMRNSQIKHLERIIDGHEISFFRKNEAKMKEARKRFKDDLEKLDYALSDLSKVGTPIFVHPKTDYSASYNRFLHLPQMPKSRKTPHFKL